MTQPDLSPDPFVANYDEALVGDLPIPNVLTCIDGTQITSARQWQQKRRPELLALFSQEMFGKTVAPRQQFSTAERTQTDILNGLGRMSQITLRYGQAADQSARLLYILPAAAKKPVPIFVSLNFGGNQEIMDCPMISMPTGWFPDKPQNGYINNRATDATRGINARRWPIEAILKRGYGIATAYYGDFDPDFDDGFQNGVHPLGFDAQTTCVADDQWGAIGAWAWGLSLLADYLITLPQVDAARLIVLGHSRLGKAALWAGAQDERFAIVISNNSGCGGAALSRRNFGESLERINQAFPHWFCRNFHKYGRNASPSALLPDRGVAALPFDQHALIALMAPRPVYIASASEDLWADPQGEFLAAKLASPVYALFGKQGLPLDEVPALDTSVGETIGYHNRTGKHDILSFDWERYMDFADKHFQCCE